MPDTTETTTAARPAGVVRPSTSLDLLWAVRDVRDDRLRPVHRHVLLALVSYRSADGTIEPSVGQLADATGLGRSTILRALDELEGWGYLRAQRRGGHRSSIYTIVLPARSRSETSRRETSRSETSRSETSEVPERDLRGPAAGPSEDLPCGSHPEDPPVPPERKSETRVGQVTSQPRPIISAGATLSAAEEAYVEAVGTATGTPRTRPLSRDERACLAAAAEHARADGATTTADALAWIHRSVGRWVRGTPPDEIRYTSGWSPTAWGRWLDGGGMRRDPRSAPTAPPPAKPKRLPCHAEWVPPWEQQAKGAAR